MEELNNLDLIEYNNEFIETLEYNINNDNNIEINDGSENIYILLCSK